MESVGVLHIDNYKDSSNYEKSLSEDVKKSRGIYYTPKFIVKYILEKTLKNHDILSNPCPKILDISCGCGNFLLEAYDMLYDMIEIYNYKLNIEDIHTHILEKCIYGIDIDESAINILKCNLVQKDVESDFEKLNIYCFDSLNKNNLDKDIINIFWESKFDYIVGNPPYIGHKNLNIQYKKWLLSEYKDVYKDKSDIYFCFYKRIIDLLSEDGICGVITPRYFLQSPSGRCLRDYIKNNSKIKEIVDFNGSNVFKNISVASCIMTLTKNKQYSNIDVYKLNNQNIDFQNIDSLNELFDENNFMYINIHQSELKSDWIIADEDSLNTYNKIEEYGKYKLGDICVSFQGIITGCDKAFVIDTYKYEEIKEESKILKKWIKNKQIKKYKIDESNLILIYSDDISNELEYKKSIKYISEYKNRLSNRRECKKNIRKWYELQWGRDKNYFERKKIMYPYKSKENRFAIDYKNSFCSADVYSFYIKEEYEKEFSYEYIVGILNSNLYDKYFKTFAKKMTSTLYDYYPNKVMDIKIFKDKNYYKIEKLTKYIISLYNDYANNEELINIKQKELDKLIFESIELNSRR